MTDELNDKLLLNETRQQLLHAQMQVLQLQMEKLLAEHQVLKGKEDGTE